MKEQLLELIGKIQSDKRLATFDEAATKQAVILRILNCLKWDSFNIDEVHPEYSVRGKRVDYSLRNGNYNKVFIEVKKVGEDLEKHQEQLLNYSFNEGVKLAILTNGITWWFYLPLNEGSWEQRKFYTIEIYDQEAEEITQRFIDFISKEYVISGKAVENAEKIYKGRQKQDLIKLTMPKAWNRIIEESNEGLIEIIAETTEKMCGYKPDADTVAKFINNVNRGVTSLPVVNRQKIIASPPQASSSYIQSGFTGKSIKSFIFQGAEYDVRTWKDLLIQLCNIILSTHRDSFDQVLNLSGRKRPYFTREPNELRSPHQINGTNIFVEINLSSNSIVKLSQKIIALFGYSENDLSIEAQ
jgi:hypothetical protein